MRVRYEVVSVICCTFCIITLSLLWSTGSAMGVLPTEPASIRPAGQAGAELSGDPVAADPETAPAPELWRGGYGNESDLYEKSLAKRSRWQNIPVDGELIELRSSVPFTDVGAPEGVDEAIQAPYQPQPEYGPLQIPLQPQPVHEQSQDLLKPGMILPQTDQTEESQFSGPLSHHPPQPTMRSHSLSGLSQGSQSLSALSQEPGVTARLSSDDVAPNELLTVTLSIDDPVDLYYFSTLVMFDPDQLEYISLENTGITDGGVKIDGMLNNSIIAMAVSRTDTVENIQSGDFMRITFRVRSMADTAAIELNFMDQQMSDSAGDPIDFTDLEPVEAEVVAGIGMAELAIPAASAVTEGESFFAKGRVHASGVTTVDEEEMEEAQERITAWIGVSDMDSDPELWEESAWKQASLEQVGDNNFFIYSTEVALHRPVGNWYLAFRADLDGDGNYVYGGLDGFWNGNDSRSAHLDIERMAAFRYTLASWDFGEARNLKPTQSIPVNDSSELRLHGIASGSGSDPDTQSSEGTTWLNTRSWEDQPEHREKYLHVTINTSHFEDLHLSSSHTATSAGPRLRGLELSLDGSQWEAHEEGEMDLRNSSTIHLQNLVLPDRYEDQEEVHIRWVRRGTERVGEEGGEVSSAGIHRIADIRITGIQTEPRRVHVLPGDINQDGVVNSQDVLQLGYYWLSRGPLPAYSFMDFQPREVETWVPEGATYADANGDGVVDHRDLQPIGLNFGRQRDSEMEKRQIEPEEILAGLALPPLKQGESMTVQLESHQIERLRGVAWRFRLEGIAGRLWRVESDEPAEWASSWSDQEILLTFQKKQDEVFEEARVVRGRQHQDEEASQLASVRIVAEADWPAPGHLMLDWVVNSRQDGTTYALEEVMLSTEQTDSDPTDDERPEVTRLLQNFPNPFQSETSIHYELSETSQVRLEVFSINGKRVATLVDGYQETGRYAVSFDASGLSSGVYLYRLVTGSATVTRSLVVVR